MEHFDNLIKNKIEGKVCDFHHSNWKSFCTKAGINQGLTSWQIFTIASISVAVVTSIIFSTLHFTQHQNQSNITADTQNILEISYMDTCKSEFTISFSDSTEMELAQEQELATITTPVKKENNAKKASPQNETKTIFTSEPKIENPPKNREYFRKVEIITDTIKSDNQLMEWEI